MAALPFFFAGCTGPTEPTADSFSGRWSGPYQVEQCTFTGWPSCGTPADNIVELQLTQTDAKVVGTFTAPAGSVVQIPVSGTVNGDVLTLAGTADYVQSTKSSSDRTTLEELSASIDGAGAMRASFRIRGETTWGLASPYPPGEVWSTIRQARVDLVRR